MRVAFCVVLLLLCAGLLQQEEEKAWKKIHQTKKRAREIIALRSENEARLVDKQRAAAELARQQREISERQAIEKEMSRKARQVCVCVP